MILHLWHPNSPLSHPAYTKRAFFSPEMSDAYVEKFQERVSPYESFIWPIGMMKPFVNDQKIVGQISSWGSSRQGILVLGGEVDKIMRQPIMEDLAEMYRKTYRDMVQQKKLDGEEGGVKSLPGEGGQDNSGLGVRYCVVPRAGHHLQNDIPWEIGAKKLLDFYEQL
jgi:hypothetical protein